MNDTFLLFFFDMRLPYAFYLTYLNMSLPAGVHESPNTCLTCVCQILNLYRILMIINSTVAIHLHNFLENFNTLQIPHDPI
jgi:hypothetical protein